ncbi:MAG: A/G-specific adenine glycosylase [Verrucomicrobiota bacterium]|jgi:A/G-specific adenine glycosylase
MTDHTKRSLQHAPTPERVVLALLRWFAANARALPWRRTRDPYAIWVSEIMLQQTQVKTVIPYWERWLRELPMIESLANAKPEKIHKLWEGLGYYTRVRNLQKAAQHIVSEHDGKFPAQFDDILELPGIGRYTAGAIASIAYNQPAPILDGNVIRVLTRLHGIGEDPLQKKTNARLWHLAEELVTHASCVKHHGPACSHLNQSLMELGALICTPRSPNCAACPIAEHCIALRTNRVDELPRPKQRATLTARRELAFVVEKDGKYLVRQRPVGVVNAHLWEFPNCEAKAKDTAKASAEQHFHSTVTSAKQIGTVKHAITRYRYVTEAFLVKLAEPNMLNVRTGETWKTMAQLNKLAFTSAHRRIISLLEG